MLLQLRLVGLEINVKAAYIKQYGDIDKVVQIGDMPKPKMLLHDTLIEVRAAGVNPVDWKIAEGHLKNVVPLNLPAILGSDVTGVVVDIGDVVTRFQRGDEVFARVNLARSGSFAEYVSVDEKIVALKPKNIDFVQAAGVPLAALTAWQALFENIQLQQGQKILIHGGAGGVGTFAIQFAKYIGAQVATTVSAENVTLAEELGADWVIDYQTQRFEEVLQDFDAVLDTVGGDTQTRSMEVLKSGGVLASTVGVVSKIKKPAIRIEPVVAHPDGIQLSEISQLIEAEQVQPVIDRSFPLGKIKEALRYSQSGHAKGKIVLEIKK